MIPWVPGRMKLENRHCAIILPFVVVLNKFQIKRQAPKLWLVFDKF